MLSALVENHITKNLIPILKELKAINLLGKALSPSRAPPNTTLKSRDDLINLVVKLINPSKPNVDLDIHRNH